VSIHFEVCAELALWHGAHVSADEYFLDWPEGFVVPDTAAGWLEAFLAVCPKSPWGIAGHAYFPGSTPAGQGQRPRTEHVLIGFGIHGNEWGTLPAAVALAQHLASGRVVAHGPVSLLLGNLDALRADVRFVEEDFNRVFSFDQPALSRERKRALTVRPLLDEADFFLDLHQTQTPTESAFWTFPWSDELAAWARIIGAAPRGLVRAPGGAFAPGRKCLDEYVRDRGKCGITAEMGEKGASFEQARAAYQAVVRLIHAHDEYASGAVSIQQIAERMPAIEWYQTVDVLAPPTRTSRLHPGFACFTAVEQGQVLSVDDHQPLLAAHSGVLMFPKYPERDEDAPPELVRLATAIENPSEVYSNARAAEAS